MTPRNSSASCDHNFSLQCREPSNTLLRVCQWAFPSLPPVATTVALVVLLSVVVGVVPEEGKRRDMVAILSVARKETLGAPLCVQEHLGFSKEEIGVGLSGPGKGSLARPMGGPWPS